MTRRRIVTAALAALVTWAAAALAAPAYAERGVPPADGPAGVPPADGAAGVLPAQDAAGVRLAGGPAGVLPAGGAGDAIVGDLNGDGRRDLVTLAGHPDPDTCEVRFRAGRPGGGYLPAVAYPFRQVGYCPDMGTAADLQGDGRPELVLAWFWGAPHLDGRYDLLILRDFAVVARTGGPLYQPSFIGAADFDGDGRQDVYEYAECPYGLASVLSTGVDRFAPGPVAFGRELDRVTVRDLDRDGGDDVLIDFSPGACGPDEYGVAVVRGDGHVQYLERAEAGGAWTSRVVQANRDRYLDIRTEQPGTGRVGHHLGTGDGVFVRAPRLTVDQVHLGSARPVVINVLANDWVTTGALVEITVPPRYGAATVTADRKVRYVPDPDRRLVDRFVYRVTEPTGDRAATSVYVRWR